jgi:hypothetical protein
MGLDETRDCTGPVHVQLGCTVRLNVFRYLLNATVADEDGKAVTERSIRSIHYACISNEEIALAVSMFTGLVH